MIVKIRKRTLPFALSALAFIGCGDDEKKAAPASPASDDFRVVTPSSGAISLDFGGAGANSKWLVIPFLAGDNAAGADVSDISTEGAKASLTNTPEQPPIENMNHDDLRSHSQHLSRSIQNRLDYKKGETGQTEELWGLVRAFDQFNRAAWENNPRLVESAPTDAVEEVRGLLRSYTQKNVEREGFHATTVANPTDNCTWTDGSDKFPRPNNVNATIKQTIKGDGYCLIVLQDLNTSMETLANIQASISAVLTTYKKTVYKDDMTSNGGRIMKPYFVIDAYEDIASVSKNLGFFSLTPSKELKTPVIYLINDASKVGMTLNDRTRGAYHGLIAHELQHGIVYYYKGQSDTYSIDEGIAHLYEDLFGYRDYGNFTGFAHKFLDTRDAGFNPVFVTVDSSTPAGNIAMIRGASHSLFYYLSSQMGGITFSGGKASGGDGLNFLADVVKTTDIDIKNVSKIFTKIGWTWPEAVGGFLSALILDNSGLSKVTSKSQVQAETSMTNLQGKAATFGLRFNNFTADGSALDKSWANVQDMQKWSEGLKAYEWRTFKYTVTDTNKKIVFKTNADSAAAIKVRVE